MNLIRVNSIKGGVTNAPTKPGTVLSPYAHNKGWQMKIKRKYECDEEGHANDGSCLCFKSCDCKYCRERDAWKDLGK
jgi:hypothetical protein